MNTADEDVVAVIQGTIEPMLVPARVGFGADQSLETIDLLKADICWLASFRPDRGHIPRSAFLLRHHEGLAITAIALERRVHHGTGLTHTPQHTERQMGDLLGRDSAHQIAKLLAQLLMQGGDSRVEALHIDTGTGKTGHLQGATNASPQGKLAIHLPIQPQAHQLRQIRFFW